jgi:hypothetical protein
MPYHLIRSKRFWRIGPARIGRIPTQRSVVPADPFRIQPPVLRALDRCKQPGTQSGCRYPSGSRNLTALNSKYKKPIRIEPINYFDYINKSLTARSPLEDEQLLGLSAQDEAAFVNLAL